MTEHEWLTSTNPQRMLHEMIRPRTLNEVNPLHGYSERKLWLFVAAVERVWVGNHMLLEMLDSIELIEAVADGKRPERDMWKVSLSYTLPTRAAEAAQECVRVHNAKGDPPLWADILRDIIGNPWRPAWLQPLWICSNCEGKGYFVRNNGERFDCRSCGGKGQGPPSLLTPTVLDLARAAYEERVTRPVHADDTWSPTDPLGTGRIDTGTLDPDRLAVLCDALEEAGCAGEDCAECEGHGRRWRCSACRGEWLLADGEEPHLCPVCHEHRTTPKLCKVCGGHGRAAHSLLDHLRSPGPHVRGCVALDAILGLE